MRNFPLFIGVLFLPYAHSNYRLIDDYKAEKFLGKFGLLKINRKMYSVLDMFEFVDYAEIDDNDG